MAQEVQDKYRKISPTEPGWYQGSYTWPPSVGAQPGLRVGPPPLTLPDGRGSDSGGDPMTGDPVLNTVTPQMQAPGAPPPVIAPPPAAPPPPVASPEQDAYRQMTQAGPRRSMLGTIAGGLVRAGAAYANSSNPSRPIAQVDNQNLQDWAQRNPAGPGSYREGMGRQKELAGMEAGDQAKEVARQKAAMDAAHTQSSIDLQKQQGAAAATNAETQRLAEAGRVEKEKSDAALSRDTENRNIGMAGGRELAPGEPPPANHYVYKTSDGRRMAVPSKQSQDHVQITLAEAREYNIVPSQEELAAGTVSVDRRLWGWVVNNKSKPDTAKRDDDYWNNQMANSAPGSPEYVQAEAAMARSRQQYTQKHPWHEPQANRTAADARVVKGEVGRLLAAHANDYKAAMAENASNDEISDEVRAGVNQSLLQQARTAREPGGNGDLAALSKLLGGATPNGPPPVGGGSQGGARPIEIEVGGKRYKYSGTGSTADMKNYTEVQAR